MTIWYKQGVEGKHLLHPLLQKAQGRIHDLYQIHGEDMYVTSLIEGTHSAGSLHPLGRAEDFRYGTPTPKEIRKAAGPGFDFYFHKSHIHMEYDPK